MSARNRRLTIERLAKLGTALGFAVCIAAFAPASAFGGCGGGGGGGSHQPASSSAPPASQQNDPQKLKQLKDLTKRLKSELHLDNQKSKDVQAKESGQIVAIRDLLDALPDKTDPAWKDADNIQREALRVVDNTPLKY
jgi:hypothetical protein